MLKIDFNPFPKLETERLTLREFKPEDAKDLFRLRTDERVLKHLGFLRMKDIETASAFIERMYKSREKNQSITWVIRHKDKDELIGTIVYWNIQPENYRAEIGYVLHPDHWGKGYMTEAMLKVLNHGFSTMKLHSIEALVSPENQASVQLLIRLGFTKEGLLREAVQWEGKFSDQAIYSLICPE